MRQICQEEVEKAEVGVHQGVEHQVLAQLPRVDLQVPFRQEMIQGAQVDGGVANQIEGQLEANFPGKAVTIVM